MKRGSVWVAFVIVSVLVMLPWTGTVVAQDKSVANVPTNSASKVPTRAIVQIPFDFFTFYEKMPPGKYSITRVQTPLHLFFRNLGDPKFAFEVFTIPGDTGIPLRNSDAKLVFVEREGTNFLVGIVNENGEQRITTVFGKTRRDTDIRKEIAITLE